MKKFLFVTATRRGEDERDNISIIKCLDKIKVCNEYSINTKIFYNNSLGLSEVYNSVIDEKTNDADFIVFVHDDLYINDCFVFDKLIEAEKHGDIIGLCGGKAWIPYGDVSNPMIWTEASKRHGLSGFMCHSMDRQICNIEHKLYYNNRSLFSTNYGNSPAKVLTIDGCCICFTKKAIKKGVRFDKKFKFHFYDIDMCFDAFTKKATIITYPILATHESIGLISNKDDYIASQKLFLEKWFEAHQST